MWGPCGVRVGWWVNPCGVRVGSVWGLCGVLMGLIQYVQETYKVLCEVSFVVSRPFAQDTDLPEKFRGLSGVCLNLTTVSAKTDFEKLRVSSARSFVQRICTEGGRTRTYEIDLSQNFTF